MLTRTEFKQPALRIVKCKHCREPFQKKTAMHTTCSAPCILRAAEIREAKRARQQAAQAQRASRADAATTRAMLDAMKGKPALLEEAQKAFNAYIRLRDAGKPCICCGAFPQSDSLTGGEWDAGHFRSRGACPEIAFDEDNCHAQTKRCNRRAWDVASYRANLLLRIGPDRLAALEGPHAPTKWSRDDLRAIRQTYRAKAKALKAAP